LKIRPSKLHNVDATQGRIEQRIEPYKNTVSE